MLANRILKLQKTLKVPLLVSSESDLAYLTGHLHLSGSFLLITKTAAVIFGSSLENVQGVQTDSIKNISKYLGKSKLEIDENISLRRLEILERFLPNSKMEVVQSLVGKLRIYKDKTELANMQKAYAITIKVFGEVKKYLAKNKNIAEKQLAKFIHITGLSFGADDISFPVIVASGANSAIPHHVPSDKKFKKDESVVLDFGFKVNGYCSDFTRTIFIGTPSSKMKEIYFATEKSYKAAIAKLKNNISASEVDIAAREVLDTYNLEQYFIHSLGHGTGLEVHEEPYVYKTSKDVLKNNMVFSIEPGVYIEGVGGVRIEDLVYLSNGKVKYFKKYSTDLKNMII